MSILPEYIKKLFGTGRQATSKNVALVLSGGGARGYFHIGAIEVLQERGYNIVAVAGTSMGALVGAAYANGKLNELKAFVTGLNKKQIANIITPTMGLDHVASDKNLIEIMKPLLGKTKIEDLPIPFVCCASDIVSGTERVFQKGSLLTAVRASISIPCFFKPVSENNHINIDGSIHNTLPLDRVARQAGDLLVAINVNGSDTCPYNAYQKTEEEENGFLANIRKRLPFHNVQFSANYLNMAIRVASLTIQTNTQLALKLTPPDICAELPMNAFSLFDFDKATEIIACGRAEMERRLDEYEQKTKN